MATANSTLSESDFRREMLRARTFAELGDRPDYWAGFMRGLRRRYHGAAFGSEAEHRQWLRLGLDGDPRAELGAGYRAGLGVQS